MLLNGLNKFSIDNCRTKQKKRRREYTFSRKFDDLVEVELDREELEATFNVAVEEVIEFFKDLLRFLPFPPLLFRFLQFPVTSASAAMTIP